MIVNAAIRVHGGTVPPTADLSIVRRDDRRLVLVVRGLPAGLTLTKLVWTGKVSASDLDSAKTFQKVITASSTLASVGRITDTGTNGVARATCSFTPSDSASWPDTQTHQLWAVLSDGNPYQCLTGTIRSRAPIPISLITDTVVASVTVSPASASIVELGTQQFTATARNAAGQVIVGAPITWSVPVGGSYASVDASGLATGLAIGSATIRATSGGVYGEATLGVTLDTTPASVAVSPSTGSIAVGATQQFTATVKNANNTTISGATVTWSSLATGIATVNGSGLATGVAQGSATIRATSGSVYGDAALTVTPSGPATLVLDTFTRADNPTSLGTADTGQVWSALAGTWSISSNRARLAVDAGDDAAVVDAGAADVAITVDVPVFSTQMRWVWRATDANNYFMAMYNGGWTMYRRQGGSYTSIASSGVAGPGNGSTIEIDTSGSGHTLKRDGTTIMTATDAFQSSATKHGLGFGGAADSSRFDNFKVTG